MVRRTLLFKKRAFTMIELIFAIVVIAISVISLPMMMQSSSKATNESIVQEAIFAAEAILDESTAYYWDANSTDDYSTSGYSRVINTGDCIGAGVSYKRKGHINRQCLDDNTTGVNLIGSTTSVEDAATQYSNTPILTGSSNAATYKNSYNATVTVTYCKNGACIPIGDSNATTLDNLKQEEITIVNADTNKSIVVLRAYVANIGEVKIESRIF